MLLPLRKWIFCLLHASTLVSLIHLAEIPTSCGPNCAFLRAAECIFLQRPTYECDSNDAHIPSSLLKLLDTLPQNIKNLILNGKFKIANSSDMMRVSPSLLNLIPTKVVQLNAEIVSSYLRAYPYESLAATKLISCLNSSRERKAFLEIWSGVESNSKIEDIVASALTIWKIDADWNFLDLVDSNSTVLLHLPPDFLLTFDTKGASEFLFHLGSKFNSISHAKMMRILRNLSSKNLKVLQRAWAILAMRELPDKIKWNKYNFILPGLTLDELKNLEIDEVKPIIAYDFSVAQIRTVVSKIIVPWHINFKQVALWVKFMSPSQIQNLWQFNFKDLKIMANETASYITAKQILLYQLYQLNQKYVKEGKYPNLNGSADLIKLDGGFVAILPLAIIEQLSASDVLTLDSLQKIDSSSMSLSMAYYLTDESRVFNLGAPSKKLTGIRGMLRAIPTSQIMAINGEMSSIILHHLLQNLQGDNVLRNLELLKKCRSFLGNVDYVLKFLLENKDKNMYFSLLSPKDIAHISLSSINDLVKDNYGQRIQELPSHILAAILSNNSPTSWTWNNMFNSSNAFESLLMGLSCKEIRKIADSDFITIIGRYNDERMKIGRVFPKNLQHCGQAALINYLLLKSNLYNEPELIDLLEPSDIEAVGGYILASLPVEEILQAQYSAHIISAIGQLSLPELMLAASQDHLNTLMDEYLNKDHNLTDILNLRNLIHFIPASALVKINPMDLKYMIESGIIDKRLCGDSSTREAWSRLLITIYGSPSKWNASQLETVGDLMIAFSSDRLDTIDSAQWQLLADIAVTRYTDIVEWPKTSTFYQACMSTLIKSEQKRYLEAVKSLARKYFTEVQRMASSIKLNTKDDSIVLIKTNKSSSENLPVPKIISLDEGGSSAEDMYEIFTEEPSTKSHQETTPSPQQLHPKDTLKMKSVSVSSFKSPSEIISTSRTSPEDANVLSSSTKFHPGNVSGENYNPHPRIKSQEDSNEDHASQTNTDSEENGATLFKSPGFPLITEVSTGTPHQQNETPDYKAGKIISLDNISEMLDLDYDHPLAEVIGKEGISSSEADARFARFRRNADQPSNSGFCDSVKVLGASAVLAVRDFDLHSVTNDELLNCVEDLGKLDLPQSIKEIIWQRVKSLEVVDMAIGTLAGAWKLDDANNVSLNISEDWNLEIIHLLSKYNKDNLVASAVVKKMKKQIFTGELIGEVPEAVIVAMGPLLCHLNPNELQLMFQTPGTFMHVIPIIGNMMRDCEMECLSKFAKLAVAFMDTPDLWTSDMVALLGPIPAGLDEDNWRLLASRPQSVSGLRPSSLECLPQSFLQMMGVEALGSISPLTAKILTDNQLKSLEKQKADVLISVKNEQWSLRNISALHKLNIDTTTKPKIEVDLSSNSNSVTPSILIAVCLSAIFSSWC
nr:PREDICTED: uncharacterized protein LOC109035551 isoform X2 [Bemisia tabaci]